MGQFQRRLQSVRAALLGHIPHDGAAAQIGAGGDDGGFHIVDRPCPRPDPGDSPVLRQYGHHLALLEREVLLQFQGVLHDLLIAPPVSLGPEGPDGGAFSPIEQPVLDAGFVRRLSHLAAQRIQLPDQVALPRPADGGVAGHIAHGVQIDGKANGF